MKKVVGVGDVTEYCRRREMRVTEQYTGRPLDYQGRGKTLVWGGYHTLFEFYYVKYRLKKRNIDLLSTQDYGDMGYVLDQFVEHMAKRDREENRGGRAPFGWRKIDGTLTPVPEELRIADKVLCLREGGYSIRAIQKLLREEGDVTETGKPLSVSGISTICKKKEFYRNERR